MLYQLFIIPIIVMLLNQAVKMTIDFYYGRLKFSALLSYGGIPSGHSALVTSLATVLGFYQGLGSPAFAVALILALITVRDASGLRGQVGQHGKAINQLIKELPDNKEYIYPVLIERLGHRNIEVVAGIIFGFIVTLILAFLWPV